jgi:predicted dehydrogenase
MDHNTNVKATVIGCGGMARHHVRKILANFPGTSFPVICEPSIENYEKIGEVFMEAGINTPPNEPDLRRLLKDYQGVLDAAFIVTPHCFHHDNARDCLLAGLDVLLEKPMVMNAAEAISLISARDQSRKHLVVAFQSSLSPHIQKAATMLVSGELGEILNINAMVWQGWAAGSQGSWRQNPQISGGGFLFDTGAHMLNTVTYLAGEDFSEIAAWFDYRGRRVDILTAAIGRLKSGALVSLTGCGDTIPSCSSDVLVFCTKGILRTGVWGGSLEVQYSQEEGWLPVEVPPSLGEWEQFLLIRDDLIPNPSPAEIGLRLANLWDAIKSSASQDGAIIKLTCQDVQYNHNTGSYPNK